jgi:hypothetical protein
MTEQFQTGLNEPGRGIGRPCKHCRQKFIPKRSDAEFCTNLCRQVAYYKRDCRKKDALAAEIVFKRRQNGLAAIADFGRYQSLAGMLHSRARDNNFNTGYMATRIGLLKVGSGSSGEFIPGRWEEIKTRSDSREITALLSQETFVGSYIAREAERECRELLAQAPTDVSLFVEDARALENSSRREMEDPNSWADEDSDEFDAPFWH